MVITQQNVTTGERGALLKLSKGDVVRMCLKEIQALLIINKNP